MSYTFPPFSIPLENTGNLLSDFEARCAEWEQSHYRSACLGTEGAPMVLLQNSSAMLSFYCLFNQHILKADIFWKAVFSLDQTSLLPLINSSFFSVLTLHLSRISKLGCKWQVFRRLSGARMGKAIVLPDTLSLVQALVIQSACLVYGCMRHWHRPSCKTGCWLLGLKHYHLSFNLCVFSLLLVGRMWVSDKAG